MTLLVCLVLIGIALYVPVVLPIRVGFESSTGRVDVQWLFVRCTIALGKRENRSVVTVFGKPVGRKKRRGKSKATPTRTTEKRKRKLKKWSFGLLLEVLRHPAVFKGMRTLLRFGMRFLKAVRIQKLRWELGLQDYYWQGIIHGATACLPQNAAIRIDSNYRERNRLELHAHIPPWRLLYALLLLLCCFPYWGAFRLYRSLLSIA